MPNTAAAKKALRASRRKRVVNLQKKKKIIDSQRDLRKAIKNNEGNLQEQLAKAFSALDKAAKSNFIPKQRAKRKKSRLAKMLVKS
jgi:ribosomal protein S20